jgi:hypothetical protein
MTIVRKLRDVLAHVIIERKIAPLGSKDYRRGCELLRD